MLLSSKELSLKCYVWQNDCERVFVGQDEDTMCEEVCEEKLISFCYSILSDANIKSMIQMWETPQS